MNINLGPTPEPNFGETMESMQDEIDEHIEIMRRAGERLTGRVMLLSDPEYPGAYRVWIELEPTRPDLDARYRGSKPSWIWVTPDGEAIMTQRPWAVTE